MMNKYNGEITITSNLFIKLADYDFLKFTGLDMNASVESVFSKDDIAVIKNAFNCVAGSEYYVTLSLRRADGVYCGVLATFFTFLEEGGKMLRIKLFDLNELQKNSKKLRFLERLSEAYFDVAESVFMRYEQKRDVIEIFYVSNSRRNVVFEGTSAEFKKWGAEKALPESESEFSALCDDIFSCKKNFCRTLKMRGLISGTESELYTFGCRSVSGDEGTVVAGCITAQGGSGEARLPVDSANDKDVFLDMLNKRAVTEQAREALASGKFKRCFIVLFDLDNFKSVNDVHGHIVGDEVLINVTRIINENLGNRGIVGRMGGDEILIFTETIEEQTELRNMLRTIRTTIEWTFKNDPRELNVTCSMGVATSPENGSDFDKLYNLADKMLYLAKEKGKNRYIIYTPELHDSYLNAGKYTGQKTPAKNLSADKVGIMQRLVDDYLTRHSYNNEKMFSEIGEAFNLSEVLMIYEEYTVAFQWTRNGVFSDIGKIAHFTPDEAFVNLFNKDNLLVLDGLYKLEGRCPEIEKRLVEKGVKSALFYKIERHGEASGYVMFAKDIQRQMWSEYEIMALSTAAKVFDVSMHV